jgi:hypothetical protein
VIQVADRLRQVSVEPSPAPGTTFEDLFADARLNPNASLITGGVRVENVEDPLMQKIRYLDELVDELAQGKVDGQDPEVITVSHPLPQSRDVPVLVRRIAATRPLLPSTWVYLGDMGY